MPTSTGPAAADDSSRSGREEPSAAGGRKRRNGSAHFLSLPTPLVVHARLADLPETADYRRAVEQAADRIAEWVPKGVHFGWERSFRNKGKFPATMSKDAAGSLVAGLLRSAPLTIYPNRREDGTTSEQLRVVAEADGVVGTRGQRRVRIVLVRDAAGFLVENAFPVHAH
jgi:hypothetical protein